jgi:hypothetical protein
MTGKAIYSRREVFPRHESAGIPQIMAAREFDYVIFPRGLYEKKEPLVWKLMTKKIILPVEMVASATDNPDEMSLMRVIVRVPPSDWRRLPPDWRMPATQPAPGQAD